MLIKDKLELAKYFNGRGFKIGAEIGVLDGDYALTLCKEIPGLKYYGIDSWLIAENMPHHKHRGKYEHVLKILEPYDATVIRKDSMEAVKDFENNSLDFVYIDANHMFDYVVKDIIEWAKKVKKGGIVAGHDYREGSTVGVIPAVDGYAKSHGYSVKITTSQEEEPSWYLEKRWNS